MYVSLFHSGSYIPKQQDQQYVQNIVVRYNDIADCWNDKITKDNVVHFVYRIKEKVAPSKVWTNSDEFAYVILETMNDRGLSLTQVEMLRSYLLAHIYAPKRARARRTTFENVVKHLMNNKLNSKSKAKFEFFKMYFKVHYAEDFPKQRTPCLTFSILQDFKIWAIMTDISSMQWK